MTGAAEGTPTSFAKLHFFIFLWVPLASPGVQNQGSVPWDTPTP